MKRLLITAALLCATAPSAFAAALWQGELFIISTNGTCLGFIPGTNYRTVFRPAGISTNGRDTSFTLVGVNNAWSFVFPGVPFAGNGTYNGTGINPDGRTHFWNSAFLGATVTPKPTDTTTFLNLSVTLNDFEALSGCNPTWGGLIFKVP
jgi:hypothetical protein